MGAEEIIQWVAIGMSLMGSSIIIALKILGNKRNNKRMVADAPEPDNPGVQLIPGKEEKCIEHGKALTELETEMKNLDEDFKKLEKNNREDHNKIFDKLNRK